MPGRKTDVKDAEWLAQLLQVGLLKASFVPPAGQREMRDLTRHRSTFIRERATLCNRVQKVLESANIKLACVATDVLGVLGRAMLDALVAGETDVKLMAELSKGRLRDKRAALEQALLNESMMCTALCWGSSCARLTVWTRALLALTERSRE